MSFPFQTGILNTAWEFFYSDMNHPGKFGLEEKIIRHNPGVPGNKPPAVNEKRIAAAWRFYRKATELRESGQFEAALEFYNDAMMLHPKFLEAYDDAGVALLALGRIDEAKENFERTIGVDSCNYIGRTMLGTALAMQGKYDEAEKELEKALLIKPHFPTAIENLERIRLLRMVRG